MSKIGRRGLLRSKSIDKRNKEKVKKTEQKRDSNDSSEGQNSPNSKAPKSFVTLSKQRRKLEKLKRKSIKKDKKILKKIEKTNKKEDKLHKKENKLADKKAEKDAKLLPTVNPLVHLNDLQNEVYPLHKAVEKKAHYHLPELLKTNPINIVNKDGKTVLDVAIDYNNSTACESLLKHGAKITHYTRKHYSDNIKKKGLINQLIVTTEIVDMIIGITPVDTQINLGLFDYARSSQLFQHRMNVVIFDNIKFNGKSYDTPWNRLQHITKIVQIIWLI